MDELAAKLECHRDLGRDCVHIDMDAYFAAVEMRDDPRLRTVPMAVGSMSMLVSKICGQASHAFIFWLSSVVSESPFPLMECTHFRALQTT